MAQRRPFYSEFAWAYDRLIDRPVKKECSTIVTWLVERDVQPGARLVDAGCGTGRYAAELARRGYVVHGVDESGEMIALAREACRRMPSASLSVGDLADIPADSCRALLCRGALNDLIDDGHRRATVQAFAKTLVPPGVLIADVREWTVTAARKAREPLFCKRVETERGLLTFTSTTELDESRRMLLVRETHTLTVDGRETKRTCDFAMRCWTRAELDEHLTDSGFGPRIYFGAYDRSVSAGETDRIVVVASIQKPERLKRSR